MGKSKHRKDHKKKANIFKNKLQQDRARLKKMMSEQFLKSQEEYLKQQKEHLTTQISDADELGIDVGEENNKQTNEIIDDIIENIDFDDIIINNE